MHVYQEFWALGNKVAHEGNCLGSVCPDCGCCIHCVEDCPCTECSDDICQCSERDS